MKRIGFVLLASMVCMISFLMGCEGDAGPAGPAGPPGPTSVLGYATINGDAAAADVRDFGGGSTTGVTVTRVGAGNYDVTFTGTYSGVADVSDITILATISDTNNYHVASASADQSTANGTTVVVRVFVWSTGTTPNPLADEDFSVVVLR